MSAATSEFVFLKSGEYFRVFTKTKRDGTEGRFQKNINGTALALRDSQEVRTLPATTVDTQEAHCEQQRSRGLSVPKKSRSMGSSLENSITSLKNTLRLHILLKMRNGMKGATPDDWRNLVITLHRQGQVEEFKHHLRLTDEQFEQLKDRYGIRPDDIITPA